MLESEIRAKFDHLHTFWLIRSLHSCPSLFLSVIGVFIGTASFCCYLGEYFFFPFWWYSCFSLFLCRNVQFVGALNKSGKQQNIEATMISDQTYKIVGWATTSEHAPLSVSDFLFILYHCCGKACPRKKVACHCNSCILGFESGFAVSKSHLFICLRKLLTLIPLI